MIHNTPLNMENKGNEEKVYFYFDWINFNYGRHRPGELYDRQRTGGKEY